MSLWAHCDFNLMIFRRRGRGRARRRSTGKESVAHLPNSCCHSFLKSPRCPKSKALAVQWDKALSRCPKSTLFKVDVVKSPTLSKKKKKKFGNLTRSGTRVRGLGLVWTSALTRSDQDQHQTRSQTRHRNLTRLVSCVPLTSLK